MLPAFTTENSADTGFGHAVFFGEGRTCASKRGMFCPDFKYLCICQFGKTVFLATRCLFRMKPLTIGIASGHPFRMIAWATCGSFCLSSFFHLVFLVFSLSTEKMVVGVTARRAITRMADTLVFWVNAGSQKVSNSIGSQQFLTHSKYPIAFHSKFAFPSPAFLCCLLGNFGMKSFYDFWGKDNVGEKCGILHLRQFSFVKLRLSSWLRMLVTSRSRFILTRLEGRGL